LKASYPIVVSLKDGRTIHDTLVGAEAQVRMTLARMLIYGFDNNGERIQGSQIESIT